MDFMIHDNLLHYYVNLLRDRKQSDTGRALSNIIKTMRLSRHNKICGEDFSKIDLGFISLNGIHWSYDGKLPCNFQNCAVSLLNFTGGHSGAICDYALTNDFKYAITCSKTDFVLIIWDIDSKEIIKVIGQPKEQDIFGPYYRIAVSNDYKLCAALTYDGSIRVIDIDMDTVICEIKLKRKIREMIKKAFDAVECNVNMYLQFSEDGDLISLHQLYQPFISYMSSFDYIYSWRIPSGKKIKSKKATKITCNNILVNNRINIMRNCIEPYRANERIHSADRNILVTIKHRDFIDQNNPDYDGNYDFFTLLNIQNGIEHTIERFHEYTVVAFFLRHYVICVFQHSALLVEPNINNERLIVQDNSRKILYSLPIAEDYILFEYENSIEIYSLSQETIIKRINDICSEKNHIVSAALSYNKIYILINKVRECIIVDIETGQIHSFKGGVNIKQFSRCRFCIVDPLFKEQRDSTFANLINVNNMKFGEERLKEFESMMATQQQMTTLSIFDSNSGGIISTIGNVNVHSPDRAIISPHGHYCLALKGMDYAVLWNLDTFTIEKKTHLSNLISYRHDLVFTPDEQYIVERFYEGWYTSNRILKAKCRKIIDLNSIIPADKLYYEHLYYTGVAERNYYELIRLFKKRWKPTTRSLAYKRYFSGSLDNKIITLSQGNILMFDGQKPHLLCDIINLHIKGCDFSNFTAKSPMFINDIIKEYEAFTSDSII